MQDSRNKSAIELPALALASMSVLGSQIAVTRILSLKYAANQTFLVVSFAVLGLAIGAGLAHRGRRSARVEEWLPARGMWVFAGALLTLSASFQANLSARQQILLVPLPFVGVGMCIAAVFARRASRAGFYYAVDLTGAAIGAYCAAPLLDVVPAPTALLLFAATGAMAASLFGRPARARVWLAALGIAAAVIVALGLPGAWTGELPIYPDRNKDMLANFEAARRIERDPARHPFLEDSRWSAFGRTDVVNDVTMNQKKVLYVDGASGSPMFADEKALPFQTRAYLRERFGPSPALGVTPLALKRTALAIGSGGGRDVLLCRMAGVGKITAVELNADVVEIVREDSEFNGGVYEGTDVEVVIEEGRHFLRSSDESYDVILLSLPVTKRGEGYGGFALSESFIFTRESIGEYLDHLNDEGQLLIVCHSRQEVGRLINTYLLTAADRGIGAVEAMQRVAVYGDQLITVVVKATPPPESFWRRLERETRRVQAARPDKLYYFMPGTPSGGKMTAELAAVAAGSAPAIVHARRSTSTYEPDMSPVTDDRPFFYFFTESLPPLVREVLTWSGVVLAIMLLWGLWSGTSGGVTVSEQLLWRIGVACLGVAFMLVEIPLIQRFVFWFGRPTLALGLLLGTLLLATGAGSLLAAMFVRGRASRTWPLVAVLAAICIVGFAPLQRAVFAGADGSLPDALLRSFAITCPLGLLMGVPFPMLLAGAGAREGLSVAWLWGINGVGSVLGSAAAVAIAMLSGYSTALVTAGVVYGVAAVVIALLSRYAPGAVRPSA